MFRTDEILFRNMQTNASGIFHKNIPGSGDVMTKRTVKIE
jgi:hypothetical protein